MSCKFFTDAEVRMEQLGCGSEQERERRHRALGTDMIVRVRRV